MSSYYILAIDQGTTSSRAMIFDQDQHIIAIDQQEFPQHFPQPGWVEHDAEDIWLSVLETCRNVIAKSQIELAKVIGVGISNQRETSVMWDRTTGAAVAPAIVWQDRRTAAACEQLKESGVTDWLQQKTGLLADPYFSASKIRWMLDNISGLREKAEAGQLAFGTVESFLVWRLTNGKSHVTDVSNASRTLLMNIRTCEWDEELLTLFDIPKALLPRIVSNAEQVGQTDASLFGAAISITGMAGDQQAALIGQACVKSGMLKATLGTGAFLMLNTGAQLILSQHQLLTTVAYSLAGKVSYALEGSIFSAGTLVQWLRDELQIIHHARETEALARSLNSNDGVYFVPAFTGLGAPYWRPDVQGALSGITRGTSKAHIVRAALEAIAYQLCDVQQAMVQDVGQNILEMRVDGGLTANDWLLQFMTNLLDTPILLTANQEASCYGANLLAAIGAGCYQDLDAATSHWHAVRKFLPLFTEQQRSSLYTGWLQAVRKLIE